MFPTFARHTERRAILWGMVLICLVIGWDVFIDIRAGLPLSHVVHEILILAFCLVLVIFQARVIIRQKNKIDLAESALANAIQSREEFQRKAMRFSAEFSAAVSQQFAFWRLTESERDIAILIIKGMSMKEIAEDRSSRESTVRQQAMAIYRKANLENRQQLVSFFLEDLFSANDQEA